MYIRDLPPELQELVHKRQKEQGNDGTHDEFLADGKSSGNFNWIETPEGQDFWSIIDSEDFEEAKLSSHYPKLQTYEIY